MTESSNNTADHNLDLSLGNLASRRSSKEMEDNSRDQHCSTMPFEFDWRHQGSRSEVYRHQCAFPLMPKLQCYICDDFCETQLSFQNQPSPVDKRDRRDGYNETDTLRLLSQTHIHSPSSLTANEMHQYGQFTKGHDPRFLQMFAPFGSQNFQVSA